LGFIVGLGGGTHAPVCAETFRVLDKLRVDNQTETGGHINTPYGGIGRYENLLTYSEELTQTGS